ncbi:MAG TPA: hypothetical protein VFE50_01700 [Cyclobacteriaceae bacterium]|nr:hypothetical protein [Cyclobacteriaceae bacterium]
MRTPYFVASVMLCGFLAVVFTIAYFDNRNSPLTVVAGEASVGTWASGMLLVISATISLIFGMRRGWFPWSVISLFFLILALDERFMFHEGLKTDIIMGFDKPGIFAELPVILGAFVGLIVSITLWKKFHNTARKLLVAAVVFGVASVTIDVFALGVFWEDSFKLIAELAISCAFLSEV